MVVAAVKDIAQAIEGREAGASRLWLMEESGEYSREQACADWLDIINGGNGPWPPGSYKTPASPQTATPSNKLTC